MDAVKGMREVAELVKKYNDLPLYEKIVNLQGLVVEQASEIFELSSENAELKKQLSQKVTTNFRYPYYYEDGDDIPLCPKCFVNSDGKKRSHMANSSTDYFDGHGRKCTVCDELTVEGPRKKPFTL